MMKEAVLYEPLESGRIQCKVCLVRCKIAPGKRGFCGTRLSRAGKLYSLIYSKVSSVCIDPIEKKPYYHLYPGTEVLSLGSVGCNFKCPGCQNWSISKVDPEENGSGLDTMTPEMAIAAAKKNHSPGICWTYNEPAIWLEYTLDCAKLAKENNLYTGYVSNGYASREHLDMIAPYLDGYKCDLKAFNEKAYRQIAGFKVHLRELLDTVKYAYHQKKIHIELITNVTPTINDDPGMLKEMAQWIRQDLNDTVPWHVTRFYPYEGLSHLQPTPVRTLENAYDIGKAAGLHYVYLGNVAGHPGENTYCHHCGKLVIERSGYAISRIELDNGCCRHCGMRIPGKFSGKERETYGGRIRLLDW